MRTASTVCGLGILTAMSLAACGGPQQESTTARPSIAPHPAPTTPATPPPPTPSEDVTNPPEPPAPSVADPPATATAPAGAASRDACNGLVDDDDRVHASSRSVLASYFATGGFGRDLRIELLPGDRATFVDIGRDGPRCFQGAAPPAAVQAFRDAVARERVCRLGPTIGTGDIPDRGPYVYRFHMPGASCSVRVHSHASERDFRRIEPVRDAFFTLADATCGGACR